MICRAVVGLLNGVPPNMLPLYHSPLGMVIPSESTVSALRSSTLKRQLPVMLAPLNVSPNAINTWCSLYGVVGSSTMPLSQMTPTSVPVMPKRVRVSAINGLPVW